MRTKLMSSILALIFAAVLVPLRLGVRGPATAGAWAAIGGAGMTVRHDQGRHIIVAKDDSSQHPQQDVNKENDQGDDHDEGDEVANDHDADQDAAHHNHHRNHHSGDQDNDDDDDSQGSH